jgi:hypothetical protein
MMGDGICDDDSSYVGCMNDYGDCCKVTIMIFLYFFHSRNLGILEIVKISPEFPELNKDMIFFFLPQNNNYSP